MRLYLIGIGAALIGLWLAGEVRAGDLRVPACVSGLDYADGSGGIID